MVTSCDAVYWREREGEIAAAQSTVLHNSPVTEAVAKKEKKGKKKGKRTKLQWESLVLADGTAKGTALSRSQNIQHMLHTPESFEVSICRNLLFIRLCVKKMYSFPEAQRGENRKHADEPRHVT